jgi:outer membrane protein OmpA-like peptidoglycan-associated protein
MTTRAFRGAWCASAIVAVAIGVSCAKRPVVQPAPPPPDLIVLLPDPDDATVGHATVSNRSGTVDLAEAYASTRTGTGAAPSAPVVLDKAEVDRMFHDVLAGLPPASRHFTLYFQFASDELTAESRALTPEILQTARSRPNPDVIVVGHTDTMGTAPSNYELGLRRAAIVRNLLVAAGLDAAAIEVTSHGEGDPLVPTADETNESRNRRVEIDIQ